VVHITCTRSLEAVPSSCAAVFSKSTLHMGLLCGRCCALAVSRRRALPSVVGSAWPTCNCPSEFCSCKRRTSLKRRCAHWVRERAPPPPIPCTYAPSLTPDVPCVVSTDTIAREVRLSDFLSAKDNDGDGGRGGGGGSRPPSRGDGGAGGGGRDGNGPSAGRSSGSSSSSASSSHPLLLLFYAAAVEFTAHVRLRCGTTHWVSHGVVAG
jgi:hypothetical protein